MSAPEVHRACDAFLQLNISVLTRTAGLVELTVHVSFHSIDLLTPDSLRCSRGLDNALGSNVKGPNTGMLRLSPTKPASLAQVLFEHIGGSMLCKTKTSMAWRQVLRCSSKPRGT